MSESKTLFQKIIDREIPAQIVFEDDLILAFKDIHPQAPIHVLIIPKKPIPMLKNATVEDQALLGHMLVIANKIAENMQISDGFRIVINNGERAGQTVFHLHMHILGGRAMEWPPG
jgi:histidine triad (HIT) family protein